MKVSAKSLKEILTPVLYTGANDRKEVERYFDRIYPELADVLLEGVAGSSIVKWVIKREIRKILLNAFDDDRTNGSLMQVLKSGETYKAIIMAIVRRRLKDELGSHYHNETLGVDAEIVLNEQSPFIVSCGKNDEGAPIIQFNLQGVLFLSLEEKKILLDHEAVQIAAGYLEKSSPDDRREMKFHADHLTALLHGDEKPFAGVLSRRFNDRNTVLWRDIDAEELINIIKTKAYQKAAKQPGQDTEFDQRLEERLLVLQQNFAYASKLIYPKTDERLEELLALGPKLRYQEAMLRPHEKSREETKERHRLRLREAIDAQQAKKDSPAER